MLIIYICVEKKGGIMKKLKKLLLMQIILGALLLLLIILYFMYNYVNYMPYTTVSLENTTIVGKVIEILR